MTLKNKKVFVDSDVLIDVLAARQSFYKCSANILNLALDNLISLYTSPIVFANLFYVLNKFKNKRFALRNLRKLREIVDLVIVDGQIIDEALFSDFTDFEDAIQFYSAKRAKIDYFITRNLKDYKSQKANLYSPEQFLQLYAIQ